MTQERASPEIPDPSPSVAEARALQEALRDRLVPHPPRGFRPRLVAGADVAIRRGRDRGYAGIVVLDLETLEMVDWAASVVDVSFPYVPGLLSFRELPPLMDAWERLERRPDVVVFDGHGYAHPRRFGLACHGGMLMGVPSIGCAKTILVGRHGPLGEERGARAPLLHDGEEVAVALRTRARVKPLYVSIGNQMDLETAVALVLRLTPRWRQPETTRHAHRLVTQLRREALGR